jgi:hypothetical protein
MSLDALIMLAGAIVAALPFLGFPHAYLQWLLFALGVFVCSLGVAVRRKLFQKAQTQHLPFDENV